MGDDFSWNAGMSVLNPMFAGVKIVESPWVPDDKAFFAGPEAIVPLGTAERLKKMVDTKFSGNGATIKQTLKVDPVPTDDGLTMDKMVSMQRKIMEMMDRQTGIALTGAPEPRDHLSVLERDAMHADPAWGSF